MILKLINNLDWPWYVRYMNMLTGYKEWTCPHDLAHSNINHFCDKCCQDANFPGRP